MSAPQVSQQHYESRNYNSKERFCSFWHQADEVLTLGGGRVLEVGPGGGTVTEWLRAAGCEVVTIDHDPALGPDVVGPISALPLADDSVDVALAAQVLEHLPWEQVPAALAELARVARVGVVVTVPDVAAWAGVSTPLLHAEYLERVRASMPRTRRGVLMALARRRLRLRDALWLHLVPRHWAQGGHVVALPAWLIPHRPWAHEFDGEHYWELGTEGRPVEALREMFETASLRVFRDFRVPENPWHHVFSARVADPVR